MAEHVVVEHTSTNREEKSLEEIVRELTELDRTESSLVITGWLTSAAHDQDSIYSLQEIFKAISLSGAEQLLDSLSVLPILVPCADAVAEEILTLVSECTNAKEVVISCQEAMEHLHVQLNENDSESELAPDLVELSPALQLRRLVLIYASALVRLTPRRTGPAETLDPLLEELDATLILISQHATVKESRQLAHSLAYLFLSATSWSKERSGAQEDLHKCRNRLRASYENTITCIAPLLQASLAHRSFMEAHPRLSRQICLDSDWKDGADALACLMDVSESLALSVQSYATSPSIPALIYIGSSFRHRKPVQPTLSKLVPVVMACLQSNMVLDITLSYLCFELTASTKPSLSAEDAFNLAYTIALVSASHPDATIRLITFRMLSLSLPLLPPPQRLDLLADLLTRAPEIPPQLRVAAVGLAREAVLHALAESSPSVLSSSDMLRVLGPTILQPEPVDLFQDLSTFDAQSFLLSMEPKRLTESLSFYYVVWAKDKFNRTGIRDRKNVEHTEKSLFVPLRSALHMMSASEFTGHYEHEYTLAGLQIGLERIADIVQSSPVQPLRT